MGSLQRVDLRIKRQGTHLGEWAGVNLRANGILGKELLSSIYLRVIYLFLKIYFRVEILILPVKITIAI